MPPPQPPENDSLAKMFGPATFWAGICGLAGAMTIPLRYGEGIHGVSRNGFYALTIILLYAFLVPCPVLIYWGVFFIAVCFIKRFTTLFRHHFGRAEESGFEGYSLFCLILIPYGFARQIVEPFAVWYLGRHLADRRLAMFVMASGAAAFIKALFENIVQFNRDIVARDMRIRMETEARRRAKRGW